MKNKIRTKSLENISANYKCVLIDNCSFQGICNYEIPKSIMENLENYLINIGSHDFQPQDIEYLEKLKDYLIQKKAIEFWRENIGNYKNCYTIQEVIREMEGVDSYNYKKRIRRQTVKKVPHLLKLRRTIKEVNKERNHLIECLETEGRISELKGEEKNLYYRFYKKHKGLEVRYGLHNADFPLLIHAVAKAQIRGSSAIISNDFGIAGAWKNLSKKEGFSKREFGFVTRRDFDVFTTLRL